MLKIKDFGDTNFITGMRAFAAFAVLLIHAGGAGLREYGSIGNSIVDLGRTGVYVFFVISGYSVMQSYVSSDSFWEYINKRFWRIAPLYYICIIFIILLSRIDFSSYNILMHLTFLSCFDYSVANSIIGVEWSLSVEFIWYLLVPFLSSLITTKRSVLIAILLSILTYYAAYFALGKLHKLYHIKDLELYLAMHWSPIPYVIPFSFGVAVFRYRKLLQHKGWYGDIAIFFTVSVLAAYIINPNIVLKLFRHELILISFITAAIILFGSQHSIMCRLFFSNKLVLFLGTISYGIYLNHFLVLNTIDSLNIELLHNNTIRFIVLSLVSILTSCITYQIIERPCIRLARSINSWCTTKPKHEKIICTKSS